MFLCITNTSVMILLSKSSAGTGLKYPRTFVASNFRQTARNKRFRLYFPFKTYCRRLWEQWYLCYFISCLVCALDAELPFQLFAAPFIRSASHFFLLRLLWLDLFCFGSNQISSHFTSTRNWFYFVLTKWSISCIQQ